jgi:hypothetical protein
MAGRVGEYLNQNVSKIPRPGNLPETVIYPNLTKLGCFSSLIHENCAII